MIKKKAYKNTRKVEVREERNSQEDYLIHQDDEKSKRSRLRTTVRFSEGEYERILEDSRVLKRSPASLLRANYFSRLPVKLLMSPEDFKKFQRVYYGIANNCNQLTKRAHLGFAVPLREVKLLSESNDRLFRLVSRVCGYGED